jgi:hypothetical protein
VYMLVDQHWGSCLLWGIRVVVVVVVVELS